MPLDNDHIAPFPIELAVLFVNPNFSKSKRCNQGTAGFIFWKDTRHQFPEPLGLRPLNQFLERRSACPLLSMRARYVHGNFCDSGIAIARTIRRSGSKRYDFSIPLNNHNRMPSVEPRPNILLRPGTGFKRRHSIRYSFIIDRGDHFSVREHAKSR